MVKKFWNVGYNGEENADTVMNKDEAKKCALIAVNEIMNLDDWDNPFDKVHYNLLIFWYQVKEHINKL